MSHTLVRHADVLVTMDDARTEISDGAIVFDHGKIVAVGTTTELVPWAENASEIVDASGAVITPGLVNTHHHLFQTLTRAVPAGQNALLFDWLKSLYPIWARYRPEDIYVSAQVGLAELALSGCTMSSDHLYLYPDGVKLEQTIEAAETIGIRFHPTRGAMSIGESKGGLPPDYLVEDENTILEDCIRVVDQFHDASEGAMVRIGIAPCSPFSVTRELMRDTAILAREKGVRLHTHLAENDQDIAYSIEQFGCSPGQYAEALGWLGEDVWHAHCVKLTPDEIDLFARTKTGIAHCPCSNCRLGSGIAPVRAMLSAGVPLGFGVDGSASNDSNHLLLEARQAMLLQRVANGADAFDPRDVLATATRGGAAILGRSDCGQLVPGKRADLVIWDMQSLQNTGAWDLVAALVLCAPFQARDVFVEGRAIVRDGRLTRLELSKLKVSAQKSLARLMS